jgi:hypothetical protein
MLSFRLFEPVPQMFNGFFTREAQADRRRKKMVFKFAQLTLAISLVGRSGGARPYKSSDTSSGFDYALAFELKIYLGNGIGVNAEVYGQLPHCGQLITHDEPAGGDRKPDCALKLMMQRRRVRGVDVEGKTHCPIVLRQ